MKEYTAEIYLFARNLFKVGDKLWMPKILKYAPRCKNWKNGSMEEKIENPELRSLLLVVKK